MQPAVLLVARKRLITCGPSHQKRISSDRDGFRRKTSPEAENETFSPPRTIPAGDEEAVPVACCHVAATVSIIVECVAYNTTYRIRDN